MNYPDEHKRILEKILASAKKVSPDRHHQNNLRWMISTSENIRVGLEYIDYRSDMGYSEGESLLLELEVAFDSLGSTLNLQRSVFSYYTSSGSVQRKGPQLNPRDDTDKETDIYSGRFYIVEKDSFWTALIPLYEALRKSHSELELRNQFMWLNKRYSRSLSLECLSDKQKLAVVPDLTKNLEKMDGLSTQESFSQERVQYEQALQEILGLPCIGFREPGVSFLYSFDE